jgi:hypothetical protein
MPVDFEVRITEGWKAKKNGRIGPVVEWKFYDTKDGKTLFKFAPTLDHLNRIAMGIKHVKDVDLINKELIKQYEEAKKINDLKGRLQCL